MTVHRNVVRQNILATTTTNHYQLAKLVVEMCYHGLGYIKVSLQVGSRYKQLLKSSSFTLNMNFSAISTNPWTKTRRRATAPK